MLLAAREEGGDRKLGVRFGREYREIIRDMAVAIGQIEEIYSFFEMEKDDWGAMSRKEQEDCLRTMADDLFYALGSDPELDVACGKIAHDRANHIIKVSDGDKLISLVYLT